jgi:hypothetical protein
MVTEMDFMALAFIGPYPSWISSGSSMATLSCAGFGVSPTIFSTVMLRKERFVSRVGMSLLVFIPDIGTAIS